MTPQIEMLRALADAYDREADIEGRFEKIISAHARVHARVHRAAADGLEAEELDRRLTAQKLADAVKAIMERHPSPLRRPLAPSRTQRSFPATHRSTPAFAIGGVDPIIMLSLRQEPGEPR